MDLSTKVCLINPNLMVQKNDPFTTGVVYMPVSLAYFAGTLRAKKYDLTVIDAFGAKPNQWWQDDEFIFRGIKPSEVVAQIPRDCAVIVFYAINLTYHKALVQIIEQVKAAFPQTPLIVMENSQAVTAYSLRRMQNEFFALGVQYIVTGEAELRGSQLIEALARKASEDEIAQIDGIGFIRASGEGHYTTPDTKINDLDQLPFAAWDLFPIQNYWSLRYAHGPQTENKYMPILTSRGCPYACRFCVIPETNDLKWRHRSAKNVVDEIAHWKQTLGVTEFHIEDVDPTVNDNRTLEICQQLLDRQLNITWKICAGTKVETMKNAETIRMMARSGCNYLSISPESGSKRLMKLIHKPFKLEHALDLSKVMNEEKISAQACFVLGFPGETDEDRVETRKMVHQLTKNGIDELVFFIVSPVPGSYIFDQFSGYTNYSQLNFSPTWRQDYQLLNEFRLKLYREFLLMKLIYHPWKILKQPFRFLRRRFKTKMEMVPYRALHTKFLMWGWIGQQVQYTHGNYPQFPLPTKSALVQSRIELHNQRLGSTHAD